MAEYLSFHRAAIALSVSQSSIKALEEDLGVVLFQRNTRGVRLSAAGAGREGARFVRLGALTAELNASESSILAPVELISFQLILKDITVLGYSADQDSADVFKEWMEWQRDAGLYFACSKFTGIENAPQALHEACEGKLKALLSWEYKALGGE